jgi:alpha-ribazole phosphatase
VAKLTLVRHAETGCGGRMEGWTDSSLNDLGLRQVERLAARLKPAAFTVVYVSDLQRARQTALPFSVRPTIVNQGLREMSFGRWENRTYADISREAPEAAQRWQSDPVAVAPPGGESLTDVSKRISKVIEALRGETDALVVGHQGSLRVMICLLLGFPVQKYWQLRLDHAGITLLDTYPEGVILSRLNDCCHLEGLE